MKRRTNIFYNTGNDSKFLTFSNYTEHLTGNFLATNYKLFPSRFLCLYSPKLDPNIDHSETWDEQNKGVWTFEKAKSELILTYLTGYYENKLAFLRDICLNKLDIHPDSKLLYLNYLLDTFDLFDKDINFGFDGITEDNTFIESTTPKPYLGSITEQDYNGTFTDIICTIDASTKIKTKIVYDLKKQLVDNIEYSYSLSHLYGWYSLDNENNEINDLSSLSEYSYVTPILDGNNIVNLESKFTRIEFEEAQKGSTIKFNLLIPLYDIVNISTKEYRDIDSTGVIDLNLPENDVVKNVPYGVWIADNPVEIINDINTNYGASWSLYIGTQFKPFPNSNLLIADSENSNMSKAYSTFSQILSKQVETLNSITKYNTVINNVVEKINKVEREIKTVIDTTYINNLIKELTDLKNSLSGGGSINGSDSLVISKKDNWIYRQHEE